VEKTVTAFEARRQFGQLLRGVEARGDRVIIMWHGQPAAALVPLDVYELWRMNWDRSVDLLEEAATRANLSEDEAAALAGEAVAAVRGARKP